MRAVARAFTGCMTSHSLNARRSADDRGDSGANVLATRGSPRVLGRGAPPAPRTPPRPALGWKHGPAPSRPSARCGANCATRCAGSYRGGRVVVAVDGVDGAGKTVFATGSPRSSPRTARPCSARRSTASIARDPSATRAGAGAPRASTATRTTTRRSAACSSIPFREGWQTAATAGFQLEAFDLARDAPVESSWVAAPRDAVLIVDGIFLHRPELRDLWDWSVWLEVPFEVAYARMAAARRLRPRSRTPARTPATAGAAALPRRSGPAGRGIRDRRQLRPRPPAALRGAR